MSNKKFYYKNKNKNKKPLGKNVDQSALIDLKSAYSSEQLALTLEQLGLSGNTVSLLSKNDIKTAEDLVVRNEKDMYRVQGLNKKILFEVKSALADKGMSLRVDVDENQQQSGGQKEQEKSLKLTESADKLSEQSKKQPESRFGLADRKTKQNAEQSRSNTKKGHDQPDKEKKDTDQNDRASKKITEPLPVEEWRKIMKGGKWGYSDGMKTVIAPMYDEVSSFRCGLASVEIDGKCGYIDSQNNVVIPLEYDIAMNFSEDLAMVCKGDKCGYVNKSGEVVIPFQFDAATRFEGGEAKVKKDGKWATLKTDGSYVFII